MSPASYLTAPPRDAASILAPSERGGTVVTMAAMSLLGWISLLFLVIALAGSVSVALVRGLRAWRAFRAVSGAVSSRLDAVMQTAAEAERHAISLSEASERLAAAIERLQESLAQLAVVRSAATEARGSLLSFRTLLPRK